MRTLVGKSHLGTPGSISYGAITNYDFNTAALASNQTNATVAELLPLAFNIKILALSVIMPVVNGVAPVSVNICLGTGVEVGLGPVDNQNVGVVPSVAAGAGSTYWAADQQVNGAAAPVGNTVYNLYPLSDAEDIIWPSGSLPLTLRVVTGANAAGGVLNAVLWYITWDRNNHLPNGMNPFACTAAIL